MVEAPNSIGGSHCWPAFSRIVDGNSIFRHSFVASVVSCCGVYGFHETGWIVNGYSIRPVLSRFKCMGSSFYFPAGAWDSQHPKQSMIALCALICCSAAGSQPLTRAVAKRTNNAAYDTRGPNCSVADAFYSN